jgi:hypothetical protein
VPSASVETSRLDGRSKLPNSRVPQKESREKSRCHRLVVLASVASNELTMSLEDHSRATSPHVKAAPNNVRYMTVLVKSFRLSRPYVCMTVCFVRPKMCILLMDDIGDE